MIEIGRICVKTAGRDSKKKCVIVEIIDDNYVLIAGETRGRKTNVKHLEPTKTKIEIKKGASKEDISKELKKAGIEIKETKPKKKTEKPKKKRTVKKKASAEKSSEKKPKK